MSRILSMMLAILLVPAGALGTETEPAQTDDPALALELGWLDRDARANRLWYPAWIGIQTALTVAQVGIALDARRWEPTLQPPALGHYRGRMLVGAGTAAIGLVFVAIQAPATLGGSAPLRARLADGTMSVSEARALARARLLRSARGEKPAVLGHLGNLGLNLAAALLNALVFRAPDEAWGGFFVGVAIGEAQLWSRPRAAWKASRRLSLEE